MRIRGAVVVITGASSGIGRAAALKLAAGGARVVLAARSEGSLHQVAEACREAGGQALAVPTDVTDDKAVQALAERALQHHGRIDVWVNNAAVMAYGRFGDVPRDVYWAVIETNLGGHINGARAVLPVFDDQHAGVLINVASLYAEMTSPYVGAYVTSKYGVYGFSEVLRQETVRERDIHVCTILPASVDTPIFRHTANYTGRGVRPIPPVSSPQRVAQAIVRCVAQPRPEVVVGRAGALFGWGHQEFPRIYDMLVTRVMDVLGFVGEASDTGPGNVFAPKPEWNRVEGEWRQRRKVALRKVGALGLLAAGIAAARR